MCMYVFIYIYVCVCERPHSFTEKKSRLQGTVFWGPEVARPGKRDRNRCSNIHDVPHFRFVQSWVRFNGICQNFDKNSNNNNDNNAAAVLPLLRPVTICYNAIFYSSTSYYHYFLLSVAVKIWNSIN